MRSTFLAIALTLVVGAATTALAQQRQQNARPSYDTCEALSIQRGAAPGQGGGTNAEAQHAAFMKQCLDGKIPQ
jgi:hypothetical protein